MKVLDASLAPTSRTNRQSITLLPMKARRSPYRAYLVPLLSAAMFFITIGAQPGEAEPDGHQAVQPDSSNSVDSAACVTCHKEIAKSFTNDPHSKPALADDGEGVTCDSCHGPGKSHANDGDPTLIFNPATATAKEVDEKCDVCHSGKHADFERSTHGRGNVSCIGCHSIHAPGAQKHLLKMKQAELCFSCHNNAEPQFSMPFHHKVKEGAIECTDCHDAHGASGEDTLPPSTWQFIMCTKCHAPTAGPFVYVHPAVKAAGCTFCHYSHGGPNHKLLIQAEVNKICLQCHAPSPNPGAGRPAVPEHAQSAQSQSCISCHASIHGSNTSDVFLKPTQGMSEH